jgi:hypothetical protein
MPVSRNERIALSNLKRSCHEAILAAKKVDLRESIGSAELEHIVVHSREIADAVAVLVGEISK